MAGVIRSAIRMLSGPSFGAALVSLVLAGPARAFDVPRHVWKMDKLADAQRKAFEDKKMLVFVHAKPSLDGGDTPGKTSAAVCEEGRSFGEVVLVEPGKDTVKAAPKAVQEAIKLTFPKASPIVVLTDPAAIKAYATFGQEDLKSLEFRAIFRDARRLHRDDIAGGKIVDPAAAPPAAEEAAPPPPAGPPAPALDTWTNREGREIRARLLGTDGGRFLFELEDGRRIPVDPANLSDESRAKAGGATATPPPG